VDATGGDDSSLRPVEKSFKLGKTPRKPRCRRILNLFNSDANESVLDRRLGKLELPGAVALHSASPVDDRREFRF